VDKALDCVCVKAGGIFMCIGVACLTGAPIGGALVSYQVDRRRENAYMGAQVFAGTGVLLGRCLMLAKRVLRSLGGEKA